MVDYRRTASADGTSMIRLVSSTWVSLEEMYAFGIYSSDQQSSAEGSGTPILSERLHVVAHFLDKSGYRYRITIGHSVDLALNASTIDELPRVCNESGSSESDVAVNLIHLLD